MSHFSDFMDGVPVKISERYKRPPRIELPYSVSECTSRAQAVVENSIYCPTFETNVLSKIKELKNAKHTKKNERRHRVQLLEEAKQKKLDLIATAEAEERLKQLSVSEVSYPSTDEISALSPDDNPDRTTNLTPTKDDSPEPTQINKTDANIVTYNNIQEQQSNILQPIQVLSNFNQQNSLLDDPDPLQELTRSAKITKIHQFNHNIETLTVKDFENDTSSPFDNVELKTINDMEMLAQVLQSQRDSHASCDIPNTYNQIPAYNENSGCVAQQDIYLPNSYPTQSIPSSGPLYSSPQHFPATNGYYMPTENTCDNMMPMENVNMFMPNYQYYVPVNPYGTDTTYDYQPPLQPVPQNQTINSSSSYIPQPYYFSQSQLPPTSTYCAVPPDNTVREKPLSPIQVKSRSRSVPDIVKELDEQIKLAQEERTKASVGIVSPTPNIHASCSKPTKDEKTVKKKVDSLPNPYDKLSPKLQSMCQKIKSMGFPLARVARVCTLVGDNDKKIIEGLLIVGELMDLGFSERKVSAALAKHEFNRDKALDELVS